MFLAESIERAFGLPEGWLSEDHSFLRNITPEESLAFKAYTQLSESLKFNISAIIAALSKSNIS